jgi:hypothetical protein
MRDSTRPAATLIRVGITFTVVAAAMAALGVLSITGVIRGGAARGVFALLTAAGAFGIAGYFFWACRWLGQRPERVRQAERETVISSRLQRTPDGSTVGRDPGAGHS